MYPEYERGAKRLARHYGVKLEELMLTNGGDDALRVFVDTFVNAGERIVICEPTFPMYRYWGEVAGAKVEVLRYGADMEFPLQDALRAVRTRPQVLFICNPNNPTGTLLQPRSNPDDSGRGHAHGHCGRRGLRGIRGCERRSADPQVSAALRSAHILESSGPRKFEAGSGYR